MGAWLEKRRVFGKMLRHIFSLLVLTAATRAGFRCTFGNWACTAGCVGLGQTSGLCDDAGVCHCSARSISLDNFHAMLPSRCTLGESFCQGTCHSLGIATGTCGTYGCTCSDRFLTPSEFLLCAAESTCRLDCQLEVGAWRATRLLLCIFVKHGKV